MADRVPTARCAACGAPVDVLRAPAVRMTSGGVLVYCSVLHRELPSLPPSPSGATNAGSLEQATGVESGQVLPQLEDEVGVPAASSRAADGVEPRAASEGAEAALHADRAVAAEPPSFASAAAMAGSSPTGGASSERRLARFSLALAVWVLLVLGLLGIAAFEWSRGNPAVRELVLALVVALWAFVSQRLAAGLAKVVNRERAELRARLGTRARRIRDQEVTWISVRALRPGEGVVVEAGEPVPCDGVVLSGEGSVVPYEDAASALAVEPGLRLSAGAQLLSGSMQVVCTAAGADRTFDALLVGLRSRETFHARASRSVRYRAAPIVAVVSFAVGAWLSSSWLVGLVVAAANFAALASPLSERLVMIVSDTWLLRLARQGVDFGSEGLDAAGHVQVAVFCARGTFLAGEPEVTDIVVLGGAKDREVLALAAGAESVAAHPAAASIRRAAHDRHIGPEPTRGHDVLGGMGVTCYSADGHRVLVGTRELMMKEKVSIALSEEALRKMEQRGRSGILVAKAGRLVGLLALHDALRKGARAAVQLLLDVHIEPVLLSGEARNATEALGRALSIEHVRPEVPARERAAEVRRVIEGGASVAVVGHSPLDDSALSAASVPIVLDGSALTPRARSVTLLGDDVLTAAHALVAAQTARRDGLVALVLGLSPACLGVLCTSSLLFPPVVAPLGAVLGGGAAAAWVWSRLRATDRRRTVDR